MKKWITAVVAVSVIVLGASLAAGHGDPHTPFPITRTHHPDAKHEDHIEHVFKDVPSDDPFFDVYEWAYRIGAHPGELQSGELVARKGGDVASGRLADDYAVYNTLIAKIEKLQKKVTYLEEVANENSDVVVNVNTRFTTFVQEYGTRLGEIEVELKNLSEKDNKDE